MYLEFIFSSTKGDKLTFFPVEYQDCILQSDYRPEPLKLCIKINCQHPGYVETILQNKPLSEVSSADIVIDTRVNFMTCLSTSKIPLETKLIPAKQTFARLSAYFLVRYYSHVLYKIYRVCSDYDLRFTEADINWV